MSAFDKKKKNQSSSKESGAFEFDCFDFPLSEEEIDFEIELDKTNLSINNESMWNCKSALSCTSLESDFDHFDFNHEESSILNGDYNDYMMVDQSSRREIEKEVNYDTQYSSESKMSKHTKREQIQNNKSTDKNLTNLFPGYNLPEKEPKEIKLNIEEVEYFVNLNFEKMAAILCSYDYNSRMSIKEYLLKKKLNILSIIHKESSSDVRMIFFGLMSPRHVFPTLMCHKAITDKNLILLITILTLKPKKILEEIVEAYEKIYQVSMESEINEKFRPMNELIILYIKSDKYFHCAKEIEYYKEAERVFNIIKQKNVAGLINFMVRFEHNSFKGICNEFYHRYGFTVLTYFKKYIKEDDIVNMVDILHMSYLCPIYFYCKTIQNQISSSKPEIILPYLLIDLQDNGLEAIMSHYELIYDKFNVKKITNRFENGVKEFVDTILKNYC